MHRVRVNDPNFFSAVCEVLLLFQIETGRCVRVGNNFYGDGRCAFVRAAGSGRLNLRSSKKADIGLQPGVGRQLESCFDSNVTKLMLLYVRVKEMQQPMLDIGVARICRRQDDVLSFEELVLHSVVLELFELLEGLERPGAHASIIQIGRASCRERGQISVVAGSLKNKENCMDGRSRIKWR